VFKAVFQTTENDALTVIEKIGSYFNTIVCFKDIASTFFNVEIWLPVYFEEHIIESMLIESDIFFQNLIIQPLYDEVWFAYENRLISSIHVGQFFIPSFYNKEETPSDLILLDIESVAAFGNGKHPSTYGCLKLMSDLSPQQNIHTVLDFGCGTGILSIAMSLINKNSIITAVDNDEIAISTTQQNIQKHNISNIRVIHSEGLEKINSQKFDLILANIAADPILDLCEDFLNKLNPLGQCILSDFLENEAPKISTIYENNGFSIQEKLYTENWVSILVRKNT
jgi:ribosomal protein L11 methyltransferase